MSEPKRRVRLAAFFIRLVREKPLGTACGMIILILILVAIFADTLAPYRYMEINLVDRMQGSSARYLLGTDYVGSDRRISGFLGGMGPARCSAFSMPEGLFRDCCSC